MKKSAFISDIIFTFFVVFLFSLCLFRHRRIDLWLACLLAVFCGALASGAIAAFLQNKRKYHFLKKSEEAIKQKLSLHLVLLSDEQKTAFFQKILSSDSCAANRFGRLRIFTDKEFYFLKFSIAPVTADEIASLSRLKTNKEKILLCLSIDEAAKNLCKKLHIQVKTAEEVFGLVKSHDALPDVFLGEEDSVKKRDRRMKLCFAKNNSRRFLVSGALILITSLFTPFSYYYLIFGSLLFLTAVFVRIFGYE